MSDTLAIGAEFHGGSFSGVDGISYMSLTCNDNNLTKLETSNEGASKVTNTSGRCKINEALCGAQIGINDAFPGTISRIKLACCPVK